MKTYKGLINSLKDNEIFVFGSNPEGRHGKGAAKIALEKFGAIYGKGRGFAGQSYALVTKNLKPKDPRDLYGNRVEFYHEWNEDRAKLIIYKTYGEKSISSQQIIENIEDLYKFARKYPNKDFLIAYGVNRKNLNGYSPEEMGNFFSKIEIPNNIIFNEEFYKLIQKK